MFKPKRHKTRTG